jgi:hypothetical protein
MSWIASQLGSFWYWVQQGGNSNIVLIGVTGVYVFFTHRIMHATVRQARAALHPALTIANFLFPNENSSHTLVIENRGNHR